MYFYTLLQNLEKGPERSESKETVFASKADVLGGTKIAFPVLAPTRRENR